MAATEHKNWVGGILAVILLVGVVDCRERGVVEEQDYLEDPTLTYKQHNMDGTLPVASAPYNPGSIELDDAPKDNYPTSWSRLSPSRGYFPPVGTFHKRFTNGPDRSGSQSDDFILPPKETLFTGRMENSGLPNLESSRFRQMNFRHGMNYAGPSFGGGGGRGRHSSAFMTPVAPRKRQILFRQCFFNPISCF